MDPQVIAELNQLDVRINTLATNHSIDANKVPRLRSIQNTRAGLDKKVSDFKADSDNKAKSFSDTMKREMERINRTIDELERQT